MLVVNLRFIERALGKLEELWAHQGRLEAPKVESDFLEYIYVVSSLPS
jgi:hypothetical protein